MIRNFQPETYIVSLSKSKESDLPIETKECFNRMLRKFKGNTKVSDFIQLLEAEYDYKFELFDSKTWNNPLFLSHLIDLIIEFKQGQEIDLSELHTDLLKVFQFTKSEKNMFLELSVEERLWAIFLILSEPTHKEFIIYKND